MEHRGFSLLAVLSQGRAGRRTEVAEHRRHLANRWTRRETEQVDADDLDHNRINDKSHQLLRSDAADRLPSSENHGRSLALIFPTDTAQERSLKLGRNSGAQRHRTAFLSCRRRRRELPSDPISTWGRLASRTSTAATLLVVPPLLLPLSSVALQCRAITLSCSDTRKCPRVSRHVPLTLLVFRSFWCR